MNDNTPMPGSRAGMSVINGGGGGSAPPSGSGHQGNFWNGQGGGNGTGGGYSGYQPPPKCNVVHAGLRTLWTFPNGATLHGAEKQGVMSGQHDLVLDFADAQPKEFKFVKSTGPGFEAFAALEKFIKTPKIVRFDWPDATAPWFLPLAFWQGLITTFEPGHRVCCACFGGHGRTGTALAAILIATGEFDAETAIDFIRKNHCASAIETKGQEMYLAALDREAAILGK